MNVSILVLRNKRLSKKRWYRFYQLIPGFLFIFAVCITTIIAGLPGEWTRYWMWAAALVYSVLVMALDEERILKAVFVGHWLRVVVLVATTIAIIVGIAVLIGAGYLPMPYGILTFFIGTALLCGAILTSWYFYFLSRCGHG